MNTEKFVSSFRKRLRFTTLALIAGTWFFIFLTKFFIKPTPEFTGDTFLWMLLIVGAVNLIASVVLYRQRLASCRSKNDLAGKLQCFHTSYLIKMALIEGVALFGAVAYMTSGDERLWIGAVVFGLILIWYYPHRSTIIRDLDLSAQEEMMLD